MPVWLWVLVGVVSLVPLVLLSPIVAPFALIVLVTGVVGLARGGRTWLRFASRKVAAGVTAAAAVTLLVTGSVSAATVLRPSPGVTHEAVPFAGSSSSDIEESSDTAESARPTPTPTPTPVASTREEVVTEAVPFAETRVDDAALAAGQTQLRTAGQNGEKTLTYVVHLLDGAEVSRELVSEVVITQPVTQVVAVGTYVAPPPPPPPPPAQPAGGCDSNYADECVPVSSDVDCGGGSGDGPAYFDGVARVVGSDVYDLDRDGDGFACEPW